MIFSSPKQLKDWINNLSKENNVVANTILQNYMMERFLERVSLSEYKDNFILKGGFLIAAMVGIDMRSTRDLDSTIKGIKMDKDTIEKIINTILAINIYDNVTFKIKSINSIHDVDEYNDFRISIEAYFFTIRENIKIDITTGDVIIPSEVSYSFKLLFENRNIEIKAYNINTILAEKIETILSRNISNTRARDFYDVYIIFKTRPFDINKDKLKQAFIKKFEERNSIVYLENSQKYLKDIINSEDIKRNWSNYQKKYMYANDIMFSDIIKCIDEMLHL